MKYIINSFGGIKIQSCKRNWLEIIYGRNIWRFKVKDIHSIVGFTNKVKINGTEYSLMNGYELVKKIKANEKIEEIGKRGGESVEYQKKS